jgi:glycosyltransferase involved in cell wall biosynthesis
VSQPLLPDIGVLALVPDPWQSTWQVRHHVLSRLASYFHVVWVNPGHEWREIPRTWRAWRSQRPPAAAAGLALYTPEPWLPRLYRPAWAARALRARRLARARRLLRERGCRRVVLYVWRPDFAEDVPLARADLTCYHIDDEFTFSPVELPLDPVEARLIASVDQVFIHSPALLEKKGHLNPRTACIPNGVDYAAFAAPAAEPADLRAIPRPRMGYAGTIKRELDWPLLGTLAAAHPDWSFVFVGPRKPHPEMAAGLGELAARANVHFLGAKPVAELTAYPQHFDVCIMPYVRNDYTKFIYPLKLQEYLASGRPVVGSPIRSLEAFREVVALAAGPAEWSAALREAWAAGDEPGPRAARQAVARAHDWDVLVRQVAATLAGRLGVSLSRAAARPASAAVAAAGRRQRLRRGAPPAIPRSQASRTP